MTRDPGILATVAAADRFSLADRENFARHLAAQPVPRADRATLITCHRVEVYAIGPGGDADFDDRPSGWGDAPADAAPPTVMHGDDAVRHLMRLAVGLESAVLGEDQVLHQVRLALADLSARHANPALIRLFELAVGAGRRARAEHPAADGNLGELAVRWLERRAGSLAGSSVVVAGAGLMGRLAAAALARRGAVITVASRSLERSTAVARRIGADGTDLEGGAATAARASGVVVALAGPWPQFAPQAPLPIVDLSFPLAVSPHARAHLGEGFADVDRIFRDAGTLQTESTPNRDFRAGAEAIVNEAVAAYAAWSAGRPSVSTLRALRDRSEAYREAELRRLLRRLAHLEPREQELVEAFSQRLVAALLHEPSAALRDDTDGSAAQAAAQLFGL